MVNNHVFNVYSQDLPFDDGGTPSSEITGQWLELVATTFRDATECIAVHCVAGLGR